jgi:hypothetical protein
LKLNCLADCEASTQMLGCSDASSFIKLLSRPTTFTCLTTTKRLHKMRAHEPVHHTEREPIFRKMSFNYNKIDNDDSPDDGQQTHSGHNWKTIGIRACSTTSWFRWSCAFILHLAILAAELSILHRQPASLTVGSEINGLVPRCKAPCKRNRSRLIRPS